VFVRKIRFGDEFFRLRASRFVRNRWNIYRVLNRCQKACAVALELWTLIKISFPTSSWT